MLTNIIKRKDLKTGNVENINMKQTVSYVKLYTNLKQIDIVLKLSNGGRIYTTEGVYYKRRI